MAGIILLSVYATLAQPYRGGVQYQYVDLDETIVKKVEATVWTFPGQSYGEQHVQPVPDYGPTATPTAAPQPEAEVQGESEELAISGRNEAGPVVESFYSGWHDGGAPYSDGHIYDVVDCESTWRTVTGGYYLGLGQFAPKTWADAASITGLWDWTSPYHQGYNMAVWSTVSDPGQQWPVCWWA